MNNSVSVKCSGCNCKKLPEFFHIRKNTGERYKTCITCCERSKRKHKNRVKDKQCPHCSFATHQPSKQNIHIKTVHDKVKDYECDICNKAFEHKSHMEDHIKTAHNNIKDFECDICGQTFGHKSHMNNTISAP